MTGSFPSFVKAKICSWHMPFGNLNHPSRCRTQQEPWQTRCRPTGLRSPYPRFVPPFLVQACQSWHWSPDLVLQWPTLSRATHDWQHWGGLHHWLDHLSIPGLQQVSVQFVEDGARLLASFGILLTVQWVESPPAPQEASLILLRGAVRERLAIFGGLATPLLDPCDKVLYPAPSCAHLLELSVARSPTWRTCFAPSFAVQRVYNVLAVGRSFVVRVVLRTPPFRVRSTCPNHITTPCLRRL